MNKIVDKYILKEEIGKGSYGNVYKGQHLKTNAIFAIKSINVSKFIEVPKLNEFITNEL